MGYWVSVTVLHILTSPALSPQGRPPAQQRPFAKITDTTSSRLKIFPCSIWGSNAFSSPASKVTGSGGLRATWQARIPSRGFQVQMPLIQSTCLGRFQQQVMVCHLILAPEETKSLPHVSFKINF